MVLYNENPKTYIQLLELRTEFSKIARYRVNLKNILQIPNQQQIENLKKLKIPFKIFFKIPIPRLNLGKFM